MAYDSADRVYSQFAGPVFDFGIAKAVKGKARFPSLGPLAAQRVAVGGLSAPQGPGAQFSVLQHFGMTQNYGLTCRSLNGEAQPANQVLSKIEQGAPGW